MNLNAPLTTYEECRAHINRFNAQRSTGPKTAEGKARSSQNAFKHGLYSKQLIREGEDPAEFEQLCTALRSEHQPASITEEILVNELAHHFWRIRRFREMEARAWAPDDVAASLDSGLLALVTRAVASAERAFFRALTTLTKLQKARGFVPQKLQPDEIIEERATPTPAPFDPVAYEEELFASFSKSAPSSLTGMKNSVSHRDPNPISLSSNPQSVSKVTR